MSNIFDNYKVVNKNNFNIEENIPIFINKIKSRAV